MVLKEVYAMLFYLILISDCTGFSMRSESICNNAGVGGTCETYEKCSKLHEKHMVWVYRCNSPEFLVCCPIGLLPNDICGKGFKTRIIDGDEAYPGQFPWMVLLGYRRKNVASSNVTFACGGSLISRRYVLTAAHCLTSNTPVLVRLGEHDLRTDPDFTIDEVDGKKIVEEKFVEIEVERWIPHKNYSSTTHKNDIALLRLKRDVEFTDNIKPICLLEDITVNTENQRFKVAGWGTNSTEKIIPSKVLMYTNVTGTNLEDCNDEYDGNIGPLDETQFCADGLVGSNAAEGDSGGPLFHLIADRQQFVQYGIVSFKHKESGKGNNVPIPVVYTKVSAYSEWILQNIHQ